jgi:putative ABC transport system permease protein
MESLVTANLKQRPVRSIVSIAGVALGVALIMLFTGLARGMSNDLKRRASNVRAEIIFTRAGSANNLMSSSANLSTKYVDRLKEIDGVAAAVPVVRYIYSGGKGLGFEQIEGVDWNQYAALNEMRIESGRAPSADNEVVIDQTKARDGGLKVGMPIRLFGTRDYTVVGIYSPESGARVKMPIGALQNMLEAGDKATFIYVKAGNVDAETLARRIDEKLPGNTIQLTKDVFANVEKSIPFLNVFLRVLVILAAIVSALVVMLAMYTTITERTREIGILKAMGASRGFIVGVIEKEAIAISLLGLVVGFVLSVVAGLFIHRAYGLFFEYGWGWATVAAVIGVLGGALGALYPALRASNLDPVSALSYD